MHRSMLAAAVGLLMVTLPATAAPVAADPSHRSAGAQRPTRQDQAIAAAVDPASVMSTLKALPGSAGDWVPVPIPPQDYPAGLVCPFPVHYEATVNHALRTVLAKRPDGSPSRDAGLGALVVRVTNGANGKAFDVDSSDSVITDHHPDGTSSLYIFGPTLVGFRTDHGTLPRGLYQLVGLYRIDITPSADKILTMVFGTTENICDRLT